MGGGREALGGIWVGLQDWAPATRRRCSGRCCGCLDQTPRAGGAGWRSTGLIWGGRACCQGDHLTGGSFQGFDLNS